ncbi:hypothetical protein FBQ97_07110 [Acidobacteria bacterium ACD]|nr:hypothetical protein [Acidobacteria bacterium ACD]
MARRDFPRGHAAPVRLRRALRRARAARRGPDGELRSSTGDQGAARRGAARQATARVRASLGCAARHASRALAREDTPAGARPSVPARRPGPAAHLFVATIGLITLIMAALIACVQTDIKKVLAYSTLSQLGYMVLALGAGERRPLPLDPAGDLGAVPSVWERDAHGVPYANAPVKTFANASR